MAKERGFDLTPEVSADDLAVGWRGHPNACPVSRAVLRAVPDRYEAREPLPSVTRYRVVLHLRDAKLTWPATPELVDWLRRFDDPERDNPEPAAFPLGLPTVDGPDEWYSEVLAERAGRG